MKIKFLHVMLWGAAAVALMGQARCGEQKPEETSTHGETAVAPEHTAPEAAAPATEAAPAAETTPAAEATAPATEAAPSAENDASVAPAATTEAPSTEAAAQ